MIHYLGTMAQLFNVGNEESSVILLWTYSAAAIALTAWSTFLCGYYLIKLHSPNNARRQN